MALQEGSDERDDCGHDQSGDDLRSNAAAMPGDPASTLSRRSARLPGRGGPPGEEADDSHGGVLHGILYSQPVHFVNAYCAFCDALFKASMLLYPCLCACFRVAVRSQLENRNCQRTRLVSASLGISGSYVNAQAYLKKKQRIGFSSDPLQSKQEATNRPSLEWKRAR